jgi:hypothetical protein
VQTKFSLEKLTGRGHSKDPGVDEKIILEWILGKLVGRCGPDSSGSGLGAVTSSCGYGNKPSGSIKGEVFLY